MNTKDITRRYLLDKDFIGLKRLHSDGVHYTCSCKLFREDEDCTIDKFVLSHMDCCHGDDSRECIPLHEDDEIVYKPKTKAFALDNARWYTKKPNLEKNFDFGEEEDGEGDKSPNRLYANLWPKFRRDIIFRFKECLDVIDIDLELDLPLHKTERGRGYHRVWCDFIHNFHSTKFSYWEMAGIISEKYKCECHHQTLSSLPKFMGDYRTILIKWVESNETNEVIDFIIASLDKYAFDKIASLCNDLFPEKRVIWDEGTIYSIYLYTMSRGIFNYIWPEKAP